MKPRQILIVAGAVVVAFVAALALSGSGGGEEPKAEAASVKPAEVIKVGSATVSTGVTTAAGLPGLQVPKPKKKDKPEQSSGTPSAPSTPESTPSPSNPEPSQPSQPAPTPQPQPPPDTGGDSPINIGGGED
jgi:outer membrane biosynthesis protein TonB